MHHRRVRYASVLLLLALFFSSNGFAQADPDIEEIIAAINVDSLFKYISELSGAVPVTVNGEQKTIASRYKGYPGNDIAADYLLQKFTEYGLKVTDQKYSSSGRNPIGTQTGSAYPDATYIFSAHYDSGVNGSVSPGADDDASGVAAVIEAARLLSKYSLKYTLKYALWDEEEVGENGSRYYATNAKSQKENIKGLVHIDMIGWDGNGDMKFELGTSDVANSKALSDTAQRVNTVYNLKANLVVRNPPPPSDHENFLAQGFSANGYQENWMGGDQTPHYHKTSDIASNINKPYLYSCAKLIIAQVAALAGVDKKTIATSASPERHGIDLFTIAGKSAGRLTVTYRVVTPGIVSLTLYSAAGKAVKTLLREYKTAGSYVVPSVANATAAGTYLIKYERDARVQQVKKIALMK